MDSSLARELTLLFHFIGFGLFVTLNVAGFILNNQYKKAKDLPTKATILRTIRPIGLLSPIAILLMLITGIGNMHAIGVGLFDLGWLSMKVTIFAVAVIIGLYFRGVAGKRGKLVGQMASGSAPADADNTLRGYDKQMTLSYLIMPLLIIAITWLSVYGRLGGQ